MTDKEFNNLKPGDKVFYIANWWDGTEVHKAYELEVKGKEESKGIVDTCYERGKEKCWHYLSRYSVFLTKTEAWEDCIKSKEEAIERLEKQKAGEQRMLDRYKAGLAKAKEEERRKEWWYVSYKEQTVAKLPLVMDSDAEAEIFETEQEAYSALADFYKGKYEEALVKSGKARFAIRCQDRIWLATNIEKHTDERYWCRDYDGFEFSVYKSDTFNTRKEAEAELERRKAK